MAEFDVKISDIDTNNGLIRKINTRPVGPVRFVSIHLSFDPEFSIGTYKGPVHLHLEGESTGGLDISQPLAVYYGEPDRDRTVDGVGVFLPIFVRDRHIALYYPEEKYGHYELLPASWINGQRTITVVGSILVKETGRRNVEPSPLF